LLSALRQEGHHAASRNGNIRGHAPTSTDDLDGYDLIGFSLPFWEYRRQYVEIINSTAAKTSAKLIVGGHAATIGARYFLAKCPSLTGVVMGEGEETLMEIVARLEHRYDCSGVLGLMTRDFYQPRQNLKALDELRFPARDELALSLRSSAALKEALVETTRGCTYRCSFCSIPPYYKHAHGRRWRERSAENLCVELTKLVSDFPDVRLIAFTDDNFMGFDSRFHERAIQIARHLHAANGEMEFEITCRVDAVVREPFAELAALGLAGVFLGIESGVQRILDSFAKRTSVDQNLRAIATLSELGIGCDVGFITFSPGMTLAEVRTNLKFLKQIHEEYPVLVHPAAVFRCLREYPKDMGVAAVYEEDDANLTRLDGPVQALYEALDAVWHERFEPEFIQIEANASARADDLDSITRQKQITTELIRIGFSFLNDAERTPNVRSKDLLDCLGIRREWAAAGA
jgi:radical SAM superfamily enzyme YgiQ (UPF0313 family)